MYQGTLLVWGRRRSKEKIFDSSRAKQFRFANEYAADSFSSNAAAGSHSKLREAARQ